MNGKGNDSLRTRYKANRVCFWIRCASPPSTAAPKPQLLFQKPLLMLLASHSLDRKAWLCYLSLNLWNTRLMDSLQNTKLFKTHLWFPIIPWKQSKTLTSPFLAYSQCDKTFTLPPLLEPHKSFSMLPLAGLLPHESSVTISHSRSHKGHSGSPGPSPEVMGVCGKP